MNNSIKYVLLLTIAITASFAIVNITKTKNDRDEHQQARSVTPTSQMDDTPTPSNGYHLVVVDQENKKSYGIEYCVNSHCKLFGYRIPLKNREAAEQLYEDFAHPVKSTVVEVVN